jgi:hypothetical protein
MGMAMVVLMVVIVTMFVIMVTGMAMRRTIRMDVLVFV